MRIFRTKRKTIALIIEPDGSLTVRAPLHISQAEIERAIHSKAAWIRARQAEALRRPPAPLDQQAWFLGKQLPIEWRAAASPALELQGERFIASTQVQPQLATYFQEWYRQQARRIIAERLAQLAALHHLPTCRLRITSARTRWGSCSSSGYLNFSWRLVQAPLEIIDSVILHELAHLKVRNHSPAFYAYLAQLNPAWKVHRQWLKQHAAELLLR